ncbi:MAG: ribosome-associated translation inhibitor RaiA [Clostridia bacterium]|nr:ribosome-associated translation inhibitor RaiA [Clostridia bacterium]
MKIELQTKNYRLTSRLEEVIMAKLNRLDKYFLTHDTPCKVLMSQDNGKKCRMEVSINYHGANIRSELNGATMYYIIDSIQPKLERQITKHRSKLIEKYQMPSTVPEIVEMPVVDTKADKLSNEIAKVKKFPIDTIEVKEAVEELEMVGHDFYIFVNAQTGNVECVYRRKDGRVGLLQPYVE